MRAATEDDLSGIQFLRQSGYEVRGGGGERGDSLMLLGWLCLFFALRGPGG
jgi:hypothetical protein